MTKIISQVKALLPNEKEVFVQWETSYNYTTKTSRRRGGYSRTRRSYFWVDKFGTPIKINAIKARVDELTGLYYESGLHYWLVPIPSFWMQHEHPIAVRCNGGFPTEKSVQMLKYCEYFGTEESARTIASKGDGEPILLDEESRRRFDISVGDCNVSWHLFFSAKPKNNSRVFVFLDGKPSNNQTSLFCLQKREEERLVLIKEPKQISLL